MTEKSYPWGGETIGDCGPYTNEEWSDMYRRMFIHAGPNGSFLYNLGNLLEVTAPAGTTIRINTGYANVHGVFYINSASVDLTVVQPGSGSNYYRVVLRKDWSAQTVRLALTDPDTVSFPAVEQVDGDIWEISLAGVQITSAGAVTITDERNQLMKMKQFWVAGFKPTLTNGCASPAQIEMGTNKNVYDYCAFDKDAIEYAYANTPLPSDYTGGLVYYQVFWLHPAATAYLVSWGLQGVAITNDGALDVAQGTAVYSRDTGGTTSDLYQSPISTGVTIAGTPAAGKYVQFRIQRQATEGTYDTLDVDAYLLGALIWYPVY